jgi:hypothetical protein
MQSPAELAAWLGGVLMLGSSIFPELIPCSHADKSSSAPSATLEPRKFVADARAVSATERKRPARVPALGLLAGGSPGKPHPGLFLLAVFAPDATENGNTKLATGGLRDGKSRRHRPSADGVVTVTSAGRPLHRVVQRNTKV